MLTEYAGVWRDGGFDWPAALALLPPGLDRELALHALKIGVLTVLKFREAARGE